MQILQIKIKIFSKIDNLNFLKHNVIKVKKKKKKRKHERQVSDINMLSFEKNETITNDHAIFGFFGKITLFPLNQRLCI